MSNISMIIIFTLFTLFNKYNVVYLGKQNGKENEGMAKVVARREEKWKENAETEQKEKREGTA